MKAFMLEIWPLHVACAAITLEISQTFWRAHHEVSEEMQIYSNIQNLILETGSTFNFRTKSRATRKVPQCSILFPHICYGLVSYLPLICRLIFASYLPQCSIPFPHICHGPWFLLISGVCTASHIFTALSASKFPNTALLYLYHNHNSVLSFQTLFPEQICR